MNYVLTTPSFASCGYMLCGIGRRRLTVGYIQQTVANYFDIPLIEMTSHRRHRRVARPRQIAMYLSKRLTPKSLPDIGRRFGNRDHTTVIHAIKQIERLSDIDGEMANDVETLAGMLTR
jgi:chromosomal replication initiator protein